MLWRFEVENFFSIRERECLDLRVARSAPEDELRLVAPINGNKQRISNLAVIFGANASGKSTLLRAISFLTKFINGTITWDVGQNAPFLRFNQRDCASKPTRFYIEFDSDLISSEPPCLYSYELVLQYNKKLNTTIVVLEELRFSPSGSFRKIFRREKQEYSVGKSFEIKKSDQRLTFVKSTNSTVVTLSQFNHEISMKILQILSSVQTNVGLITHSFNSYDETTKYYETNTKVFEELKDKIRFMDLGINNVEIHKTNDGLEARFDHSGHDFGLSYMFESDGTKNFYCMFPNIHFALQTGGIAIMDELDRDIHPLMLPEIIRWFHSDVINKYNAQLIMSAHNATLLEDLIKEEVFFTEKNMDGRTEIFGLKDITGVRRDANLYSKYLAGNFGAIPKIG